MRDYKTVFVDVRSPAEFKAGHVEGAINVPSTELLGGIPPQLAELPKDTHLVLYCRSGSRSQVVMHILHEHGFTNVDNGINRQQTEAKYMRTQKS